MKKVAKILTISSLALATCFSSTGCFANVYSRKGDNKIEQTCSDCKPVTDIVSLSDNVEKTMKKVGAIRGTYKITNTKDTYNISFDMVLKDKRENWDLYAKTNFKDKDITIYFKDKKFYLIYPNNGANLIMKDSILNLVEETEKTLDKLNATYTKESLKDMMMGDKLEGFDFEDIKSTGSYVVNSDGTYTITLVKDSLTWEYDISSNFLIKETRCSAENFNSVLKFEYPESLSITYPMGLDFLTVDIEDVKEILEIETLAEIIDEDLKNNNEEQSK